MANSKFFNNLNASHADIKAKRAEIICQDAKAAQQKLIDELSQKDRDLQRKLMSLEDLGPDSTISLNPISGSFNASDWVKEVQEVKIELRLNSVELEIAKATYTEYFEIEDEVKA